MMSGTETMVTWVRRGPGGIAKKNTTISHRLLSSITMSLVTIENLPDRDFTLEQVANKLPTTSVLLNVL